MNTHAILCCLVKSLNCVVYEYVLIERVTEEVKRMLTAVNVNKVFTQSLTLVLLHFIEAARTSLLNNKHFKIHFWSAYIEMKLTVTDNDYEF